MRRRWLLALVTVVVLIVFPVVSLAAGGVNEVRLEGDETPITTPASTPEPIGTPTTAPSDVTTPTATLSQLPTIALNKHSVTLHVNESTKLSVVTTPDKLPFTWYQDLTGSISIRNDGEVLATREGTGRVTVQIDGTNITDTCLVTVLPPKISNISLNASSIYADINSTTKVSASLSPYTEGIYDVSWISSNTSVATVKQISNEGHTVTANITAVGKGTAKITVSLDGVTQSLTIYVGAQEATPSVTSPSSSTATATPGPTRGTGESGGPQPTRVPVQLDATGWEAAEEAVLGMEPGSLGSIPMPEDTLVPLSLLQTLKQTQCALEIDMGDYICTIDGANLAEMPDDFGSIDIGMTMEKDVLLSAECHGNAYELRFNYHGELPGVFTFRVKAEGNLPGDTIYVYFYDKDADEYESHVAATVDEQGKVSFGITHCSSYCITSEMIPGALNNFELPAEATEKPDVERARGFAAFVEDNYIAFWVCVYVFGCVVIVTAFVVIFHRRGKKRAAGQQVYIKQ